MRSALLVLASIGSFGAALAFAACSGRTGDYEEDFSDDVERICTAMCEKVVACRDPPVFATEEECRSVCDNESMYEDTACGQGIRDFRECIGATANCEEYLDTLDVHAEDFTCKAENEGYAMLKCGAAEGGD
jgi:hypothetical protein